MCCFFWGSLMICCVLDFSCSSLLFFFFWTTSFSSQPTGVSIWLFPAQSSCVGVCSFGSCGRWSAVGVQILPAFRKKEFWKLLAYSLTGTVLNQLQELQEVLFVWAASPYIKHEKICAANSKAHYLYTTAFSCVTLVSSVNQSCIWWILYNRLCQTY